MQQQEKIGSSVMNNRYNVGSVRFSVMPLNDAVQTIFDLARNVSRDRESGTSIHFANAYNVALARRDPSYAELLNSSRYVFSDGVPITWVGRRAHPLVSSSWERVYGPDVMEMVLAESKPDGPRHYLLGSTPEVLAALQRNVHERFPLAHIVGVESPPFRSWTPEELAERDARIRDSGAQLVWVGLGTPKQDYEVARLASNLPVVALAVGAAFDFLAGTTSQAPDWMQRNGLEWAYRLASEPGRLGKRYLWGNSVFLLEAARTLRSPD